MQQLTAACSANGASKNDLAVGLTSTAHQTSQLLQAAAVDNQSGRKRIEESHKIVDRVTRANCCLEPEKPEEN